MRAPLPLALCATLLTHGVARGTDLEASLRANYVNRGMIAEKTADVNLSEPLRYLQAGPASSKRLVVLLHGMVFTADTWKWVGTIDALAEAGFRVVALELKHYAGEYASEAVRTSLLRSFLKALGWPASPRSVLVVAASAGGSVGAPFVLDPKTAPSVAGYVSVSALGIRGNASGPSSVPALLVWGALDQPTSAKEQAHERTFAAHQLCVLPDAPHPAYLKEPELFNALVVRFASSQTGALPGREHWSLRVAAAWGGADEL